MRIRSVLLAVALAAVGLVGCGGSSTAKTPHTSSTRPSALSQGAEIVSLSTLKKEVATLPPTRTSEIEALLDGIPEAGIFLGSAAAPVTLQYFIDVSCPSSREITVGPLASIIRSWVRPGKLRLEFRSIEEGTESPDVFDPEQTAALAAGAQDKLWNYLEYFYRATERLGSNYADTCYPPFAEFAQAVAQLVPGLQLARWKQAWRSSELAGEVGSSLKAAARAGLGHEYLHLKVNRPYYPNPAYLIGPSYTQRVMTLARFARIDPAYEGVIKRLTSARVQGG